MTFTLNLIDMFLCLNGSKNANCENSLKFIISLQKIDQINFHYLYSLYMKTIGLKYELSICNTLAKNMIE